MVDHVLDAMAYTAGHRAAAKLDKTLGGVWTLLNQPKCMHSNFSGSAKQRRSLRRWHRINNPTCNDTLMENLRLGRRCTG